MSSATANSAARKRRAGKNTEAVKNQGYNNKSRANPTEINDYHDKDNSNFVPILNQRDAIYFINRKIQFLENSILHIDNKLNSINTSKIEALEKKLNDTIISNNVKINLLETDLLKTKEINVKLENEIEILKADLNNNTNFLTKMQSLVVYNKETDDEDDEDDEHDDILNRGDTRLKLGEHSTNELLLHVENL